MRSLHDFLRYPWHTMLAAILATSLLLSGCAGTTQAPGNIPGATSGSSLFERLGGLAAIAIVVDETIDHAAADPRTSRSFKGVQLKPLKENMVSQICQATGGPCKYEGRTMADAHKGLAITASEFDAFTELLSETLDKYIKQSDKYEFLQIITSMKRDIVSQ